MSQATTNGWPSIRLRYLVRFSPSDDQRRKAADVSEVSFLPMEAIGEQGTLDLSLTRNQEDVKSGYTQFFDGDVVVAKITPCFENGKGALVSNLVNGVGYGTTELHVLSPGPQLDPQFLYYVTASERFRRLGEAEMTGTAGQKRVPEDFIRDYRISVPPLPLQKMIVRYLDSEVARLDALVRAKNRLLELIATKKKALIAEAVTRGIDTSVSLRDSGVAWLGKIPVHWKTERTKWLFRERDDRSLTGQEEMLTVSHLTGVTPRSEKEVNMFEAETNEGYKVCYPGDLVINTLWAWMGAMGVSPLHGIVSPAYNVYTPDAQLCPSYVDRLVRIPVFAQEAIRFSKGVWSSRLRLYPEGFFEIWMPVPPLEEQNAIATHIGSATAELDALSASANATIALLQERRGAVITAALAGQMDRDEAL